jgi:multiple sugar transport system substrate-binding protein
MTNGASFRTPVTRRAFLGGGVGAAAALALAACTPSGSTSGATSGGSAGAPIKFWNMQWNGAPFTKVAKGITLDYKPTGKNGPATYQSVSWTNWLQTFTSAAASKTTPAVTDGAAFLPFLFQEQGLTIPCDNVVDAITKAGENDFLPGILDALKTKEGYAAVPWAEDMRVLWYRKDVLEKAGAEVPTDWDSYITAGTALAKIGVTGLAMAASPNSTDAHILFCLLNNNGGGLFDKDGNPDCVTDRNIETLDFMNELVAKKIIDPHAASYTSDNVNSDWQSGKIAMGWDQVGMNTRLTGAAASDVFVASPLAGPHGDKGTAFWINPLWMFKTTPSQESSEAFLVYYMSQIHKLWDTGVDSDVPVKKSIINSPKFQNNKNFMKAINEWQPIAKTIAQRSSSSFGGLVAVDGGTSTATLIQQVVQGGVSSKQMLENCQTALEKELKKS